MFGRPRRHQGLVALGCAIHPVIVSEQNQEPGWETSGGPLPRSRGRWPILLATAVALAGPVVFVIFPSQVMFWVMWLFFVPLVVLATYVFKKAEDEAGPEDTNHPRAEGVWLPPSDF
jgi:Ca2+/Na+ antiporter